MIYGNYALDLCNKPKRYTNMTPVDESLIMGYEDSNILTEMLIDSVMDNDMAMLEFCNEFADTDVLEEATESLWEKIKNFVKNIIQKIKDFFKMIVNKIKGFFSKKKEESDPIDDKGELKPEAQEKMEKKIEKDLEKKEEEKTETADTEKGEPAKKEEDSNSSSEESNETPEEKEENKEESPSSNNSAYPSENLKKSVRVRRKREEEQQRRRYLASNYGKYKNTKLKYTNIKDVVGMDPEKYDIELKHVSFGNNDVTKGVKNIEEYTEKSKQLLEKIKKFVAILRKCGPDKESSEDIEKLKDEVETFIDTEVNHRVAIADEDKRYGIWKGPITDIFVDKILNGTKLKETKVLSDLENTTDSCITMLNNLDKFMTTGNISYPNFYYGTVDKASISKEDRREGSKYSQMVLQLIDRMTNSIYKIYKSYSTTVEMYIRDCSDTKEQLLDLLFLKNEEYEEQHKST